ncbi:hypothetical protein HDU79_011731 [Rhizoclosmatium sp. JEL0117]|nr:hypothetical protein HDU79_011731 [Rhizoclosmatium sp. JEL0117]
MLSANDSIVRLPNMVLQDQLALGQGYDLKTHNAVQYNILPKNFKASVNSVPWSDTFFTVAEKSEEMMTKLGLEGSLKVDFFFGIVKCNANLDAMRMAQAKRGTVSAVMMYRYETAQESLDVDKVIRDLDKRKILNEETAATHVVTKIVYGGYALCTFEYTLKESDTITEIEKKIKVTE